eukprot:gb/GECG01011550.1/.p1 GENE.gb/GECG01011550.1/~~gb/GECG01011550.1/.p1  ORF type:complete len:197 (+),score=37.18 gb/GECG01011550.1/:1-591(+)
MGVHSADVMSCNLYLRWNEWSKTRVLTPEQWAKHKVKELIQKGSATIIVCIDWNTHKRVRSISSFNRDRENNLAREASGFCERLEADPESSEEEDTDDEEEEDDEGTEEDGTDEKEGNETKENQEEASSCSNEGGSSKRKKRRKKTLNHAITIDRQKNSAAQRFNGIFEYRQSFIHATSRGINDLSNEDVRETVAH